MRKLLILFLSAVFITGCGNSNSIVSDSTNQAEDQTMFERHPLGDDYSILAEKETSVCYLEYNGYKQYGIAVMLNLDGTPKVWEDYEKE